MKLGGFSPKNDERFPDRTPRRFVVSHRSSDLTRTSSQRVDARADHGVRLRCVDSAVAYDLVADAFATSGVLVIPLGMLFGALEFFFGDLLIDRAGGEGRRSLAPNEGGSAKAIVLGNGPRRGARVDRDRALAAVR